MKSIATSLLAFVALPAAADCPWADDAAMATALSDSGWHINSLGGMRVQQLGQIYSVSLVAELDNLSLSIGPLLRATTLGDRQATLTFIGPGEIEDAKLKVGRDEMVMSFPSTEETACGQSSLSTLLFATDEQRHLDTWMMLRPANEEKLMGVLKVAGETSTNGLGAGVYRVEAERDP